MSSKPPRRRAAASPQEPESDQMALFTEAAPPPRARKQPSSAPVSATRALSRLIAQITRASGLSYAEVNRRLNRRLGVTTRSGASEDLTHRAVLFAEQWLETIVAPRQPQENHLAAHPAHTAPPLPPSPRTSGPAPTTEQERAIDAKRRGAHFVLQAGAGTGKTATLAMLARSDRRRGVFIAFNRSVVKDASRKFPGNVQCRTGHSLAMRAVGSQYGPRMNTPREPGWKAGARLGIDVRMSIRLGERKLTNRTLSHAALATVNRFCESADTEVLPRHVPRVRGLEEQYHDQLVQIVLPYARRAWTDLQDPRGSRVRFDPNHALKIWALTNPVIRADYLLLDEAQDTNPVLEEVFNAQRSHAQLIMVGDSAQAIYEWRGARDVMTGFDGEQLTLSQSFRFGPALAEEANRWLRIVESPLRLRGTPSLDTKIGPLEHPDAILCRTNAGTITEILQLLEQKKRVALVGGGKPLEDLARAAGDLKAGRRASHPELILFQTWGELQDYANYDPAGGDLLALVEIIDDYGVELVLDAVRRLDSEDHAEVTISTAHKAKGREWPTVRIASDFEPAPNDAVGPDGQSGARCLSVPESRLAYVAVTRARQQLDPFGLSWVDHYPEGPTSPTPPVQKGSTDSHDVSTAGVASPWDLLGPPPPV
ncbi:UvrD-helicase domain-containing protein [Streptomyces sp. NPDC048636]|uniref:UvrD-helicase domain-containing protein n=1 Tax=Streptomyces sp. NPDC048636 TaxID=3155762 RepID=UPI003442A7C6